VIGSDTAALGLLNALRAHIAILDASGMIVAVNAAWQQFARENDCPDPAAYVGTNYLTACERGVQPEHAETAQQALAGIGAVLRGEQASFTLDYPCHSPHTERWFALWAARSASAPAGVTLVAHEEITAQKRAQAHNDQLAKILAHVNDVVIQTDQNFKIQYWGPAAEKHFGWRAEEVIGRSAQAVLGTELSETDRAASIRDLTQSGAWVGEVTQHDRHGRPLYFEANIMALTQADGQVTGYVSANREISRRRNAEQALHQSMAQFRNLTESLPDAVYTMDLGERVATYFNHDSFLGYTRAELMSGSSLVDKVHADDRPAVMAHWQQALGGSPPGSLAYRLQNKAGQWEWVESRITVVRSGPDGQPREIMVILTGITERKQAEAALQQTTDALASANRELLQAFAREQHLARIDELTQLMNRRHFFELAAHEFAIAQRYNRPLSVILFDIDRFKLVNDSLGHQAGDQVLTLLAQMASAQMRDSDVLARYGGEEFILLLAECNGQQAVSVAEKLRQTISARPLARFTGDVNITISAGVAERLRSADSLDQLIQRADQALYLAKAAGRNRVVLLPLPATELTPQASA
jgi:diguanylate cyclase (GGDEF)-like protein/PAS domain S-box-containing protein